MLITEAGDVLSAMIKTKTHVSTILWGETGVGKSSIVKEIGEKFNMRVFDIRLSQRDSVDILGLPWTKIKKFKNVTKKIKKSKFTKEGMDDVVVDIPMLPGESESDLEEHSVLAHHSPEWFVQAVMEGNCIIFLDEMNRARRETLQAVFELCLDRRLNGIELPDNVFIVVACNPPLKKYNTVEFDPALTARFMHLECTTNAEIWLKWAKKNNSKTKKPNVNEYVSAFIEKFPKNLQEAVVNPTPSFKVIPTPRGWEFVSKIDDLELNEAIKEEAIAGIVGSIMAGSYLSLKNDLRKVISLEDLRKMDDEVMTRINHLVDRDPATVDVPLIKKTTQLILENEEECRKFYKNVVSFLELIPVDLAVSVITKLSKIAEGPWADEIVEQRPVLVEKLEQVQKAQQRTNNTMLRTENKNSTLPVNPQPGTRRSSGDDN